MLPSPKEKTRGRERLVKEKKAYLTNFFFYFTEKQHTSFDGVFGSLLSYSVEVRTQLMNHLGMGLQLLLYVAGSGLIRRGLQVYNRIRKPSIGYCIYVVCSVSLLHDVLHRVSIACMFQVAYCVTNEKPDA